MKRLIALSCLFVMTCSFIVGCGGDTAAPAAGGGAAAAPAEGEAAAPAGDAEKPEGEKPAEGG
ncbi:MAG: hypothetical protein KDA68_11190 [Planctomycetaceae bacterium]|nr:hypothetical protein [Planctomycetaceae bacterium]